MSNDRSPRLDCSMTIGTSCIMSRIGDLLRLQGIFRCWRAASGRAHQRRPVRGLRRLSRLTDVRELMDDPQPRAAIDARADLKRHDALDERRLVLTNAETNLLARHR